MIHVSVLARVLCVIWNAKYSSVVNTQRAFRRQYNVTHVPSHRDIVKWYMFLENGLQMPHTDGRRRDRNKEEGIRQAMTPHIVLSAARGKAAPLTTEETDLTISC